MSKSIIEELEKQKQQPIKPVPLKRKYPTKEDFDKPLYISKYTNLFPMEIHYLRYVEKNKGSMRANQAHLLIMPTLDNEHT